jgi:hypothetical protein
LGRGEHRRHFNLWKLIVINGRLLPEMTAARAAAAALAPLLRARIVVETMLGGGTMFGLQKTISLLEPLAPSLDDRGRGGAAIAIRPVT